MHCHSNIDSHVYSGKCDRKSLNFKYNNHSSSLANFLILNAQAEETSKKGLMKQLRDPNGLTRKINGSERRHSRKSMTITDKCCTPKSMYYGFCTTAIHHCKYIPLSELKEEKNEEHHNITATNCNYNSQLRTLWQVMPFPKHTAYVIVHSVMGHKEHALM